MRLASIASGSSGNTVYVGSENTHILIDAGITNKRIEDGLNTLSLCMKDLSGIFITHEHLDHVKALPVILKKYDIPVYATKATVDEILKMKNMDKADVSLLREIRADEAVIVGDLKIKPFCIEHDAADPVAYRVDCSNKSIAVATDMGCFNEYTVQNLEGIDAGVIEANHDIRMLEIGPYPYYLKRRILGDKGHLSNEAAGRLISLILNDNIKGILLGHLSKENNYPDLAYRSVICELLGQGFKENDFNIKVAEKNMLSEIIDV